MAAGDGAVVAGEVAGAPVGAGFVVGGGAGGVWDVFAVGSVDTRVTTGFAAASPEIGGRGALSTATGDGAAVDWLVALAVCAAESVAADAADGCPDPAGSAGGVAGGVESCLIGYVGLIGGGGA